MAKMTPKQKILIIGVLLGVIITIFSFFIFSYFLSASLSFSAVYSLLTGLGVAAIIAIMNFFGSFLSKGYHYLKQPKIKIVIENAEFIAKGFDHSSTGYQLKVSIVNKGRIICPKLDEVSIDIKDSKGNNPNLLRVAKTIGEKTEIILLQEKMKQLSYCLIDKKTSLPK